MMVGWWGRVRTVSEKKKKQKQKKKKKKRKKNLYKKTVMFC